MKNFIPLASDALPDLDKRTKASWIFLLLLFFVPFNSHAEDKKPIGQVISAVGTVKATSADKTERQLKRGASIFTLETIVVNEASKVQLKFTDGGLINLIEKTEYRVESYVFKELDKKSEAVSTLVKGGFRALSGAIAKENPTGTQVRTAVATMGLRGTRFVAIFDNGKLSSSCDQGKIVVSNDKGEVEIGPTSNTLFSTVAEGEAPMPSTEMPPELAVLETVGAFDVEGGEPLDESAAAGEGEEGGGEGEAEEEPLSEDSDEGSDETSDDESEEPEPEESEEETGEETEQESEEETPEEESTYDEVEGENLTEEEEAAQSGEGEEEAQPAEGEEGTQAEEGEEGTQAKEGEEGAQAEEGGEETQTKESEEGAEGTPGEESGQAQSQTTEEESGAGSESGSFESSGSGGSTPSVGDGDLGGGGGGEE